MARASFEQRAGRDEEGRLHVSGRIELADGVSADACELRVRITQGGVSTAGRGWVDGRSRWGGVVSARELMPGRALATALLVATGEQRGSGSLSTWTWSGAITIEGARARGHPQAGILDRSPQHVLIGSYDLRSQDARSARETVERLRRVLRMELRSDLGDTSPSAPKDRPAAETGELGFVDGYDRQHLTVTVGFAKSAFDKLGIARERQPQDLVPIDWVSLKDEGVQERANGDVVVQACSDSAYVNEHVHRHIEKELAERVGLVWLQAGVQRFRASQRRSERREGRALIGFLDGTSNLNPRVSPDDHALVFVEPARVGEYPPVPREPELPADLRHPPGFEPEWTKGGTYMAVRVSLLDIHRWDGVPLATQERTVGRWKVSGSALDKPDDPRRLPQEPDFSTDPDGSATPLSAHVRKANPRAPEDLSRRIFRRGYPLVQSTVKGCQRGLVFICFGRTISTQFEFITRAWITNEHFPRPNAGQDALRGFEAAVLCGGYFFVPPIETHDEPWTWVLPS